MMTMVKQISRIKLIFIGNATVSLTPIENLVISTTKKYEIILFCYIRIIYHQKKTGSFFLKRGNGKAKGNNFENKDFGFQAKCLGLYPKKFGGSNRFFSNLFHRPN